MRSILLLALALTSSIALSQEPFKTVKTDAGIISGSKSTDGSVHIFKGIPFAAPPVGDLRWKAPQPVKPWSGVKVTNTYSASPIQAEPVPFNVYTEEFLIKKEPISEDCLYLNVWTNAQKAQDKKPVLVYIYGGGFTTGGTNVPIYDGEAMAKKGIIFITINYRVGILGFLAHPELTKESPGNASGNYGLMDQIAALKWVKQNIAAFGGDPEKVTIAGQSAGSFSVNYLVASPLAKGLFRGAIAESGAVFLTGPGASVNLKQAEEGGVKVAQALGANSLADLRKLPVAQLLKQNVGRPITDGYVVPKPVSEIFADNEENQVNLLTGWNRDDAILGRVKNAADFKKEVNQRYSHSVEKFLSFYPSETDDEAAESQTNAYRDRSFGIQNYTWANVQSDKNKTNVYVYRFTRRMPTFIKYGAFHTGEVAFAYNNLKFLNRPVESVDQQLANTMSTYWANFVKTGNPNGPGLPQWPLYNTKNYQIMVLGDKQSAQTLPDKAALDFMVGELTRK